MYAKAAPSTQKLQRSLNWCRTSKVGYTHFICQTDHEAFKMVSQINETKNLLDNFFFILLIIKLCVSSCGKNKIFIFNIRLTQTHTQLITYLEVEWIQENIVSLHIKKKFSVDIILNFVSGCVCVCIKS